MTFAQIKNGKVIALFSCDQDPAFWPGVEEVEDDDPRVIEFNREMSGKIASSE